MIKLPVQFYTYRPRVDGSVSLSFITELECSEQDILALHQSRGLEGWLLFSPVGVSESDIPVEDPDIKIKSKSQRLRSVLYLLLKKKLKREPTDQERIDHYNANMERIISRFKDLLD